MAWLRSIKDWILFPYAWFKERQRLKRRLKELQERDPFIYK